MRTLILGFVFALLAAPVFGQEEQPVEIPYDGSQAFRGILNELNMKPLASVDELTEPRKSIVIVLGDTKVLDKLPGGLEHFLRAGGAVLIATDRQWFWPPEFGGREAIAGKTVQVDAEEGYQGFPDCPFIVGRDALQTLFVNSVLFRGTVGSDAKRLFLNRVATNKPSFIRTSDKFSTLAYLKPEVEQVSVAVGGFYGKGQLLVLADHSLFINAMMVQPDTHNFDFTFNCVEWLSSGTGTPRRDRVLFVENGEVQSKFDVPLVQQIPPLPTLDSFVPMVNELIHNLQKETRGFNKILVPNEQSLNAWIGGLTVLLVFGLACYGYVWLARSRYQGEFGLTPFAKSLQRHQPSDGLVRQRQRAMLAAGNLWEMARMMVRVELPQLSGNAMPKITTNLGWGQRRAVLKQIEQLWTLAAGPQPRSVTPRQFARLPSDIHHVKALLQNGTVAFVETVN